MLLSSLSQLGNASLTISTSANGQINLGLFSEGKSPFTITFSLPEANAAELEIQKFCENAEKIIHSQHVGLPPSVTPKHNSKKASQSNRVDEPVSNASTSVQGTSLQDETLDIEDEILNSFNS
ncbi:hypothetical protein NTH44_003591 [Vibrio metoecus]